MKRRIAVFAAACLCFVASAVAQTVATTPTTQIESGVYMLRMKSDRTTASKGQWLYYADSYTYAEANDVAGTIVNTDNITSDQYNYFWNVVKNSDGSITLQSYTGNTYWAQAKGKNNAYQPNQFPMSSTSTTFTTEANGNAFKLKTVCVQTATFSWNNKNKDVYVVDNGVKGDNTARHEMGYSDASTDNGNRASIEFYAVDIPLPVSFTYNFKYNGESKATETVSCNTTEEYPDFTTTLPAYVTAQKPAGQVTKAIAGTTVDIECVANLPFETGKYYYFSCGSDDALTRLYGSSNLTYRSTASANEQASTLNDVKSDLWYVTGDPFSGFQFHNVGKDNIAVTSLIPSNTGVPRCHLTYSGPTGKNTFKLFKITDATFGIYIYSEWFLDRGNVAWHQNDANNIYFEKIDLSDTPTDAAYTFRLTEPTISIHLNTSAADNNETYATTCLPYAVEVVSSEAKAYAGKFISDSELNMVEVSAVPANQGVILKGNEGVESISLNVVSSANVIDNDLKGTTDGLSDLTNVLSFGRAGGSGKVGFYKSTNSTLPANRAYVQKTAANSVAMNFGGHTTGINAIETDNAQTANAPVYDLAGRRVSTLVKGSLYIKGGKKFIAQ